MATTEKTDAERIALLNEQLTDLAHFVGRLTDAVFGAEWEKYDANDSDSYLIWHAELVDEDTPDEGTIAWWQYRGPGTQEAEA